MKQHKTIWIILLLAALLLGASVLYTQLAPSSGALAPRPRPKATVQHRSLSLHPILRHTILTATPYNCPICRFPDCAELLGQLVRSLQERNGRLPSL